MKPAFFDTTTSSPQPDGASHDEIRCHQQQLNETVKVGPTTADAIQPWSANIKPPSYAEVMAMYYQAADSVDTDSGNSLTTRLASESPTSETTTVSDGCCADETQGSAAAPLTVLHDNTILTRQPSQSSLGSKQQGAQNINDGNDPHSAILREANRI